MRRWHRPDCFAHLLVVVPEPVLPANARQLLLVKQILQQHQHRRWLLRLHQQPAQVIRPASSVRAAGSHSLAAAGCCWLPALARCCWLLLDPSCPAAAAAALHTPERRPCQLCQPECSKVGQQPVLGAVAALRLAAASQLHARQRGCGCQLLACTHCDCQHLRHAVLTTNGGKRNPGTCPGSAGTCSNSSSVEQLTRRCAAAARPELHTADGAAASLAAPTCRCHTRPAR